ncbi:MAG TPA: Lrp/AsnC family transcriptional regulator [Gemmatimonadaceae bacterium]|jgi:DNA-binding Lrp family transcriptional regulator|nr:Lrp/AsnC family transcriptional regulator [Gemmatimonadaceae bacterium]
MAEEIAELDKIDRVLVSALQQDARLRLEDLAKLVKLVPSSVHDRLRRLERDGVIRRWTIDVNVADFGLDVLAYIGVQASKPCSKVMPFIEPIAAVEECHSVAGAKGLMLKVRVPSTRALLDLIEQLRQIPGVEGTETSIVLKTQFDRPITLPSRAARAKG